MIGTTQTWKIGDCVELMKELPDKSIDTVITSPPYYNLRDYNMDNQVGLESSIEEYHTRLLEVTAEIHRVMKDSAVLFWNHGDSYNDKCLIMQNERLIIKMVDNQGWILRDRIIWVKKVWFAKTNKTIGNCMPGSQKDRCTFSYEPIYMLTKSQKYWTDMDAIRVPYTEPMNRWGGQKLKADGESSWDAGTGQESYRERDMRPNPAGATSPNVWQINTSPYIPGIKDVDHFATFPPDLVKRLVLMACPAEICPMCGLARTRIVEKEVLENKSTPYKTDTEFIHHGEGKATLHTNIIRNTIGWTSCKCGADFVAGTVLDPFAGSGTVGEVARNLGRNAILLELNPEYEKLISDRTMAHTPPLTAYFGDD